MPRIRVCLLEGHPRAALYISDLVGQDGQLRLTNDRNFGEQASPAREVPDVFLLDLSGLGTKIVRMILAGDTARNEEANIERVLCSLVGQQRVLEILVVDDNSQDRAAEIAQALKAEIPSWSVFQC